MPPMSMVPGAQHRLQTHLRLEHSFAFPDYERVEALNGVA
jgi:hypothetical protein